MALLKQNISKSKLSDRVTINLRYVFDVYFEVYMLIWVYLEGTNPPLIIRIEILFFNYQSILYKANYELDAPEIVSS